MHARLHAYAAERARRRARARRRTPVLEPYALDRRAARRPRRRHRLAVLPRGRAARRRPRSRRCGGRWPSFGAHLCGLDVRQNSAVHEVVVADLVAAATRRRLPGAGRGERGRAARRGAALGPAAPHARGRATAPTTRLRAGRARRDGRRPCAATGPAILPHYVISKARVGQRRAGGGGAAQGGRAPDARRGTDRRPSTSSRCSRRSRTCGGRPATLAALLALPVYRVAGGGPRRLAGGDDRLLRLEQGRRLPHVELVAVPGAGRT